MFTVDKTAMGHYIKDLIYERQFKSARQFGIEYLKLRYGSVDEDAIPNIQNRISQIINGKKWIQLEDLPIFAELLGVSVEDIISAGTSSTPSTSHITNYSIAYSDDPNVWETHIHRPDNLFLNLDEYNKTIIDYALEAGNYALLKYLMDKDYIWFIGDDKKEYFGTFNDSYSYFGAGTSIKAKRGYCGDLDAQLKTESDLRFKLMLLAIKNKDFDTLTNLHAREIPQLYSIHPVLGNHIRKDDTLPKSKSIDQFVKSIASCPNTVLNYFFEPFKINPNFDYSEPTFIFPYAGVVLDHMIKQNKKNTSIYIKKAIQWNKEVINQLKELIDKSVVNYKKIYDYLQDEDYVRKVALEYYYYFPNVGFVGYTDTSEKSSKRFITNIVQVTAKSPNQELQSLIDELNESHKPLEAFLQEQKKLDKH